MFLIQKNIEMKICYSKKMRSGIQKIQPLPQDEKIRIGERLAYGAGDLASNIFYAAVTAFIMFFYTDIMLLPAAGVGTIILISRILDGVSDIAMGALIDKTRTRWGKARPWLLWMALPFWISGVLLVTVPDVGQWGQLVYVFITYNLFSAVVYTAVNIPYGTLNSLITRDQQERSILNIFRMSMAVIGAMSVMMLATRVIDVFGGGKRGWQLAFILFASVSFVLFLVTFFFTRERVGVDAENAEKKKYSFRKGLAALFQNKYWVIITLFAVVFYIYNGLSGIGVYFAQYIIKDTNFVGPMSLAGLVPILLGLFALAPFIKRFGKRNMCMTGILLSILGLIVTLINPANKTLVLCGAALRGLGIAPVVGSIFAMIADTIEYGDWKTGVRNEGLIYSAGSFGTKVGTGLGGAGTAWALSFGGYVGGADVQAPSAIFSILFVSIYLPIILLAMMFVIIYFFKLDAQYPRIIEELNKRNTTAGTI